MIDATTTTMTIAAITTVATGVMSDVTIGMTIIVDKSLRHHHRQMGATPMVRFRLPTGRSTSSLMVVRQPRATDISDQMQGRSGKSI
jgi:hypothetical protein